MSNSKELAIKDLRENFISGIRSILFVQKYPVPIEITESLINEINNAKNLKYQTPYFSQKLSLRPGDKYCSFKDFQIIMTYFSQYLKGKDSRYSNSLIDNGNIQEQWITEILKKLCSERGLNNRYQLTWTRNISNYSTLRDSVQGDIQIIDNKYQVVFYIDLKWATYEIIKNYYYIGPSITYKSLYAFGHPEHFRGYIPFNNEPSDYEKVYLYLGFSFYAENLFLISADRIQNFAKKKKGLIKNNDTGYLAINEFLKEDSSFFEKDYDKHYGNFYFPSKN